MFTSTALYRKNKETFSYDIFNSFAPIKLHFITTKRTQSRVVRKLKCLIHTKIRKPF